MRICNEFVQNAKISYFAVEGIKGDALFFERSSWFYADRSPDLIISDFLMPDMNGLEFLREAKKLYPETSMILLTCYANKECDKGD